MVKDEAKKQDEYLKDYQKYTEESLSYLKSSVEAYGKNDYENAVDLYEKFAVSDAISRNLQHKLAHKDIVTIVSSYDKSVIDLFAKIDDKKLMKKLSDEKVKLFDYMIDMSVVHDLYDKSQEVVETFQNEIEEPVPEESEIYDQE